MWIQSQLDVQTFHNNSRTNERRFRTKGNLWGAGLFLPAIIVLSHLGPGYAQTSVSATFPAEYRDLHDAINTVDSTETTKIAKLIEDCEQLIASSLHAPGVERAMYDCARLHVKHRDRACRPIGNSLEDSIRWCREVVRRSGEGTELWHDANSLLVTRLQKQDTATSLKEARAILESAAVRVPDYSLQEAEVKRQMVAQYLVEGNFDAAVQTCRELLNWRGDGSSENSSEADRQKLRQIQLVATNTLLSRLVSVPMAKAAKEGWLDGFANEFKRYKWLDAGIALAHRRLERQNVPDPVELVADNDVDGMNLVVLANVLFLAIVGAVLGYRHLRKS